MENELNERNDLIRRGDAIDLCEMAIDDSWEYDYATDRMFEIPAVDAVEVVRCKDCRYFCKGQNEVEAWEWCDVWKKDCWSDCYCASGQRREDGDGDG